MVQTVVMSRKEQSWSKKNSAFTLDALRETYPRYTDNELYAIWCRDQGCIPLDEEGKVQIEQWQIHAATDGEHVQDGGFKVSRPLFGRARKAQAGVPKPVGKPRGRAAAADAAAVPGEPEPPAGQILSDRAVRLARRFDRAAAALEALRPLQREVEAHRASLAEIGPGLLSELAGKDQELQGILRDLGLLPAEA